MITRKIILFFLLFFMVMSITFCLTDEENPYLHDKELDCWDDYENCMRNAGENQKDQDWCLEIRDVCLDKTD